MADPICPDHIALLGRYQKAMRDYNEALEQMQANLATIPQVEFEVLARAAASARQTCQSAGRMLRKHLSEHGCSESQKSAPD